MVVFTLPNNNAIIGLATRNMLGITSSIAMKTRQVEVSSSGIAYIQGRSSSGSNKRKILDRLSHTGFDIEKAKGWFPSQVIRKQY